MPLLEDPRAEAFAQHYAVHRIAKQARDVAGYPATTNPTALVSKREIATRIKELWGQAFDAAGVTPDMVFEQLRRFAFPDVRALYDDEGNLKPIHQLDDEVASTIIGIDVETRMERDGPENFVPVKTTKIRRVDPMAALSVWAKHHKIVGDDGEGVNALAATLAARLDRARQRDFGSRDVEDARIIPPRPIAPPPQENDDERLW
jgi:phage terminase small subunit